MTGVDGAGNLSGTFDGVAELYERVRPTYPPELFDDLARLTGLDGSTARVVEIGPGTGQATRSLLRRGWSVVAVERGAQLAAVADRVLAGLGDVQISVGPFEAWQGAAGTFDLVFAATAWHWLDPAVAYPKAAGVLRPGGHLAVVSTEHVLPEVGGDPFFVEVEDAYTAAGLSDGLGGPSPPEAIAAPEVGAITASGVFAPPTVCRYVWSRDYTTDEYLALLGTYSGHIAATDHQRQVLFTAIRRLIGQRPGGTVRKHYLNVLHVARRLEDPGIT